MPEPSKQTPHAFFRPLSILKGPSIPEPLRVANSSGARGHLQVRGVGEHDLTASLVGVLGFRVEGFRVSNLGFRGLGFRVKGFRASNLGFRGLGFRVEGFRASNLGFRGLGFRVEASLVDILRLGS